jgi:hypothetical protein
MRTVADLALLELGQHHDFISLERCFETVGKADPVGMVQIRRCFHDNSDGAARMVDEAGCAGNIHQGNHLRAHGENQARMVVHSIRHSDEIIVSLSI